MNIPFHKPHITQKEIDSVCAVLQSGWLTMGPITNEFEIAFRELIGKKFAISVNSATSALHLALNAVGINKNDEVIIPTNTFVSTAEVVVYLGAKPVLCDVEGKNHNINIDGIKKLITPKTKAIIPVHFGGHPCRMDEILNIAHKYNLKVIEDAAHALPSSYKGNKIGGMSDATCFSFYATKTLTTGDGGMVVTNDERISKKISLQRLHGIQGNAWNRYKSNSSWNYEVIDIGYKYNTTDIQSAIGIVQLEKLEWMREKRKIIAEKYIDAFNGKVEYINESPDCQTSWHLFVIKITNRNELHEKLTSHGIHTSVHFIPIHKHPYYNERFQYKDEEYPIANNLFKESLSLPIYPGLTETETDYIISTVLKYANKKL